MTAGAAARPGSIAERLAAAGLPPLPRPAWLEIDLDALTSNVAVLRGLAGGAAVTAVVKADAYGHGIEAAARTFLAAGADSVAVATLDEALHLRRSGVTGRILVLFRVPRSDVATAAEADLELVVADPDSLAAIAEARLPEASRVPVHLEVETGLSRAGFRPAAVAEAARTIAAASGAALASVWSHLATPEDPAARAGQVERFEAAVAAIGAAGIAVPERHLSATGGLLVGAPPYERVRPGLSLYGIVPAVPASAAGADAARRLRPAMALRATAIRVEPLEAGESVGYGGTWIAPLRSLIATLPVGYGDGWARAYAKGDVLVRGQRTPLVGTIAMDSCMADVTAVEGFERDDTFTLLGADGEAGITAGELAHRRNTNEWEVVATMATRLPRVYHAPAGPTGTRSMVGEVAARAGGPLSRDG